MYHHDEHNENHFFDKNNHNKKYSISLNDIEAPRYQLAPLAVLLRATMKAPQYKSIVERPPRKA